MLDKTNIIEIINDWNYYNREFEDSYSRDFYDEKIANFINKDEVVVIKGVRRSGKSTLMLNQIKKLVKSGIKINEILFVNLEDPRFLNHLDVGLLELIKETYLQYLNPSSKPYIFLDEIQNIPNWEKWVNKEYELKKSYLTITGSNSSMLSSEIASVLSGRYISIDVYPLSFSEFLKFRDINISSKLDLVSKKIEIGREFERFIKIGGFPKVLDYNEKDINELLTTYKDSILLKDIVARFKLKNFHTLEEIAAFLLSNTPLIQSITKLKNSFSISFDMARDYLDYLKKAYMIFEIRKFDYSLKKQNMNDKKYFSIDLGLSNLMRVPSLQTRGADLETIVFLELKRRGYKIYYYKTSNDLEIDFLIEKSNEIVELIQVSKTLKESLTYKRELAPFSKTIDELSLKNVKCTIITQDNSFVIDKSNIEVINIQEFLLKGLL